MTRRLHVLHVCNYFDPAGDITRCFDELRKYSRHAHELIVRDPHPRDYGHAEAWLMAWNTEPDTVKKQPSRSEKRSPSSQNAVFTQLSEWCHVAIYHFVGPEQGWRVEGKPSAFRNCNIYWNQVEDIFWSDPEYNAASLDGFNLVSSSHAGAQQFLPGEFRWLPDLIPIFDMLYSPDAAPRVPCVSYIKHGDEFDRADFNGAEKQRMDWTRHPILLAERRRKATVVIDNVCDGHYGLAGLETLSQGLPCVVFNHEKTRMALEQLAPLRAPFIEVGPSFHAAIEAAKRVLSFSDSERADIRRECREWMESHYDPKRLISKYWDPFAEELAG